MAYSWIFIRPIKSWSTFEKKKLAKMLTKKFLRAREVAFLRVFKLMINKSFNQMTINTIFLSYGFLINLLNLELSSLILPFRMLENRLMLNDRQNMRSILDSELRGKFRGTSKFEIFGWANNLLTRSLSRLYANSQPKFGKRNFLPIPGLDPKRS